jgi:hypothetical protein
MKTIYKVNYVKSLPFETLIGKTVKKVSENKDNGELHFKTNDGTYCMSHKQECCEDVELIDVIGGDLDELVGNQIVDVERVVNDTNETGKGRDKLYHSWTFINIKTKLGVTTLRWYSSTSGAYSVDVNLWETQRVNVKE